ncbi:YrhK family protein [Dietzia sp. UCD-THP]|uniref:YrhK family protein n=1 Tax=Dietzia sp. UCD-THP TaxID=1292020 RepID=UPI001EE654C7|nr:YrhK family protein [Dietzia sp. UCD-THP]
MVNALFFSEATVTAATVLFVLGSLQMLIRPVTTESTTPPQAPRPRRVRGPAGLLKCSPGAQQLPGHARLDIDKASTGPPPAGCTRRSPRR